MSAMTSRFRDAARCTGMITAMTTAAPPFQRFLLEHRDAVLRLLVGMVGPIDADDCFQESFLKALRAWPPADLVSSKFVSRDAAA